jgi:hypothetical protein
VPSPAIKHETGQEKVFDREEQVMRKSGEGWARTALKQQLEIFGENQVSLDSLWRAVGSPSGHDPRCWSDLAAPLLSGFSAYLSRLDGDADATADPSRMLWIWRDDSKDPWHTGDLMTHEFIAWAYATYLDVVLDNPTSQASGTLAHT